MTKDLQDQKLPLGVIIAGGRSSRMGNHNKLLLPLGDKTILEHVIENLKPQVGVLYLNLNDKQSAEKLELKVVPDQIDGKKDIGPIGGIYTALKLAISLGFSRVVTAPGDTPFLPDNFVEKLIFKNNADVIVAASNERRHPILALWQTDIIDIVEEAIAADNFKMMQLLDKLKVNQVNWDDEPDPFFNVNTEEEYEIAASRL